MIKDRLEELAKAFADEVVSAVRGASIEDILGTGGPARSVRSAVRARPRTSRPVKGARPEDRLARRSKMEVLETVDRLVMPLLRKNKAGLRSEQIRAKIDVFAKAMPRILKEGIAAKKLRVVSGSKRATVYGLAGARKAKAPARKTKRTKK